MNFVGIVLAAGLGKRMKSDKCKVMHQVCGIPMVEHVVRSLREAGVGPLVLVVGHGSEEVRTHFGDSVLYAEQTEQLGTGHAVMQAEEVLGSAQGTAIIINGDAPLIRGETLKSLLQEHIALGAGATVMAAEMNDPTGYGRIIRESSGSFQAIVEQKDATAEQLAISEVNAGVYAVSCENLFPMLHQITNDNAQGEYYLTDLLDVIRQHNGRVAAWLCPYPDEAFGVNDRQALSEAESFMRKRYARRWMLEGVTFIDPERTYIEADVAIGADTTLEPGVHLKGSTTIGSQTVIGADCELRDCKVGNGVRIQHSVAVESVIGDHATIGPFAYLRPGTIIGVGVKVGNFVELKNSTIGDGSKIPHLSYVGDTDVGKGVNIGCGAITVNYDGYRKHRTGISDGAFIGSNVNLIAPVNIGRDAYVVAGSTITHDVGDDDLAIARERQMNKRGYAAILRKRVQLRAKRQQSLE